MSVRQFVPVLLYSTLLHDVPGIRRVVSEVAAGGIRRKCTEQCIAKTVALHQCKSIRSGYEPLVFVLIISISSTRYLLQRIVEWLLFFLLCSETFSNCLPSSVYPDELGPSLKRRKISK